MRRAGEIVTSDVSTMRNALIVRPRKAVTGEVVADAGVRFYQSLSVDELRKEIGKLLAGVEGGLHRVDAEMRRQLLPALAILKQKLPHGQWEQFLRDNKLNPTTVRMWRARERATTSILVQLLSDAPKPRQNVRKEAPESGKDLLAKAAKRMAKELLRGNVSYAKKLAAEYLEACDDTYVEEEEEMSGSAA